MASIPVQPPTGTPTIIGGIEEKNVTFLIDTSGSMYPYLPVVKEHLLEALLTRSFKEKDTMFNIVQFSSAVTPWADKLVKCTPQTVTVAGEWLRKLECSTGTNTLDALWVAFSDPVCEGVYLITDGLPDQGPDSILREVAKVSQGRPIHCIYLVGASADTPAHDFLESLAVQTSGTFRLISLTQRGDVERITVVVSADHAGRRINNPVYTTQVPLTLEGGQTLPPSTGDEEDETSEDRVVRAHGEADANPPARPAKICTVRTSLNYNPVVQEEAAQTVPLTYMAPSKAVQYSGTAWEAYRPPRLVKRLVSHSSPLAVDRGLIQGMRVLAKRERDGYYCPGILTEEASPQRTVLITFDRDPKGPKLQHLSQETGLLDVIAYNDAMRHTITPGDRVLTPWEKGAHRMAPGIVLEGIEGRSSGCAADTEFLIVNLFNGKTEKVPKQRAVWIPQDLYKRIKLEIQMPLTARQFLLNDSHYPSVTTYHQSALRPFVELETVSSLGNRPDFQAVAHGRDHYVHHVRGLNRSIITSDAVDTLIPGTDMTRDELHEKVMKQLAENGKSGMTDSLILRSRLGRSKELTDRKVCFEDKVDDSLEDSGISEKSAPEDEVVFDSGCEDDQLVDAGVQTLSLVDAGSMTDSALLRSSTSERTFGEKPMWQYWKQTPQPRSKVKVGPFRETSLSAPMEARVQPRYVEPTDYVGSLSQSTSFDDRDSVKMDNAQREWQYRQPFPPNLVYSPANKQNEAIQDQPRPTTAHPTYFKSQHEQATPAYFSYEHVGPPNRSSTFGSVDHTLKSDRAQLEWLLRHPQPPHRLVPQGPGRPVSASVGTRDMIRETREKAMLDRRRLEAVKREAKWKGKEYDAIRMKEAKEERNRSVTVKYHTDVAGIKVGPIDCQVWKFTADVIQREAQRQAMSEKQVQMAHHAKRTVSNSIRNQEARREEEGRTREAMRMEALMQRKSKRAELQAQRNKEIDEARAKRQEIKEQRHLERSQRHSNTLAEQREQQAARDSQMRNAQLDRINHYYQKEVDNQARKDLRIAVHAQKLQDYRSQVLP